MGFPGEILHSLDGGDNLALGISDGQGYSPDFPNPIPIPDLKDYRVLPTILKCFYDRTTGAGILASRIWENPVAEG